MAFATRTQNTPSSPNHSIPDDAKANDKVVYTRPNANERIEPHYFRRQFTVGAVPAVATLCATPKS